MPSPRRDGLPTGAITKGQKIGHATVIGVTKARLPLVGVPKGKRGPSALEDKFASMWQIFGNGLEPVREFRFHPERRYRFDFCWPEKMVAVELDGGVYSGGRHTRGKGFEGDCEKLNEAARLGWTVLRFTATHLKKSRQVETVERVKQALSERG